MNGRRFLAGVLLIGLVVPLLAAAPHDTRQKSAVRDKPPPGLGTRVFARADGAAERVQADPSTVPSSAAPDGHGPASAPSPEIAARARTEFDAHRAGKVDRSHYTDRLNAGITDAALAHISTELQNLGTVKSFAQVKRISQGAVSLYVFRIEFDGAPPIEEAIAWNAAGKVDYLLFAPAH